MYSTCKKSQQSYHTTTLTLPYYPTLLPFLLPHPATLVPYPATLLPHPATLVPHFTLPYYHTTVPCYPNATTPCYPRTVCCSLPGCTCVLSAGEVARYQAKALVTNSTLLAGLLIVVVFVVTNVYAAAC